MEEFKIGSRLISSNTPVYIIAEIGVNHNGNIELAKKLISTAKDCGADAVKFQTYSTEKLVIPNTPKVQYQKKLTSPEETHFDMLKKLELPAESHFPLIEHCRKLDIEFVSTPYDIASAKFLLNLGVRCFKTASADIVDLPLHEFLSKSGRPVIIATGMATLGEIEEVMGIYQAAKHKDIILLHCVSNYPCSEKSLNLRVIETLQAAFGVNVGFSDHSADFLASCIAVALGAVVIEKHFTLDKSLPGPDHKASSTPEEFKKLVESIRKTEVVLGSSIKKCQSEEVDMANVSRKSIVLNKDITKGETFTVDHLGMKRPGTGLHSREIKNIVGKKVKYDLKVNHILNLNDIE
ncbi:MAG TPA: N-acetylneuraminate synthase [Candidatus Wujingus californicus]|uniref:N-acetylneuraminate synthase n=1 Tax=Candidatus Wujingus californicus TaxID=3367618 RepID=UPI004027934C